MQTIPMRTVPSGRRARLPLLGALALGLAACGGGSDVTSPPGGGGSGPIVIQKAAAPNGDGQTGTAGQALAAPLRVLVQQDGAAKAGVTVVWATTGGGSLAPASGASDANGLATSLWTLGPAAGAQTATATVSGAQGSPLQFTATATASGGGGGGGASTVQVSNNVFSPQTLTVPAGTTVTWVWTTTAAGHDIVPDGGSDPSEPSVKNGPFTFQHTFTAPGTYNYYCDQHGAPGIGMHGTVIVQ